MKSKVIIAIIALCHLSFALPSDPAEYKSWESKTMASINQLDQLPQTEKIPKLGQLVRQLSRTGTSQYETNPVRPVYNAAKKALLATSGHSEYYGNRIREAQMKFEENVRGLRNDGDGSQLMWDMDIGWQTMSQLPSPETVRVLGEMLKDEWQVPMPPRSEHWPSSLAVGAVKPLSALPFINPPAPAAQSFEREKYLPIWQQWYAEVKSGQRSFAFIGQPVSYRFNPDGTVTTEPRDASADPPLFPPAKEKEHPVSFPAKEEPADARPNAWIIGGLSALVLSIIAFLLRKRASAS